MEVCDKAIELRVEKVSRYATALADRYLAARQKLAIIEPLLANDIAKLFDNSYGAHAYQSLRLTLMLDLLRDIWAFTLDPNPRAPSLRNIWSLIEADDLRAALRNNAAKPSKGSVTFSGAGWSAEQKAHWQARWDAEDERNEGEAFDEAFKEISRAIPSIIDSDISTKVGGARKKTIAHYDMKASPEGPKLTRLAEFGLKWEDAKSYLNQIDPVLWNVVLLATWGSYDHNSFEYAARLHAADFWARLQGKPPIGDIILVFIEI